MKFEWDPAKGRSNVRKHRVSFEEAAECFADPLAIDYVAKDDRGRMVLVGLSLRHRLIVTVYVEKHGDIIRIINARLSTRAERRRGDAMKKPSAKLPSAASLRELPELDVGRYRARRNPYAARISREGIELVHEGPSPRSLAEIPELDVGKLVARPNPYASRAAEAVARLQYGRGRPTKAREVGPTTTRSIRLPDAIWQALDDEARRHATTVHALLRQAIATFLSARLDPHTD
ncbi:MAG TPA: BrnT family toxin [Kofleriaceae bacterium]